MSEEKPKTKKTEQRLIKTPVYRSFRLQKRLPRQKRPPIFGVARLWRRTFDILKGHKRTFLGITLLYALLNMFLVQGFFSIDVSELQDSMKALGGGVAAGLIGVGHLLVLSSSAPSTSAYRLVLLIVGSLAIIWTLRRIYGGGVPRIRDGFYQGMHPFVPFILVLCVILLELLPITITMTLFNLVGATNGAEVMLWITVFSALTALTLYLLSSSIFALYIVCLPEMTPIAALRASVSLVRHRRLAVIVRVLALPLLIMIVGVIVLLPIILFAPILAGLVLFLLLMISLPVVHTYMYMLYRELIND